MHGYVCVFVALCERGLLLEAPDIEIPQYLENFEKRCYFELLKIMGTTL